MTIGSPLVGALAAAIGVPIVFALLRRTKKYAYMEHIVRGDGVNSRYKKWDFAARWMLILFAGVFTYVLWLLFCAIESRRAALLGPADFVLTPGRTFFGIPALFSGILLAAIPLKLVLSGILGKEEYDQLLAYSAKRQGIDSKRVFRHVVYVAVPLIVVSVTLALQTYLIANAKGLVIHPYFAVHERSYPWDGVQRIVLVKSFRAPNGAVRRDLPYYVLEMADGFQFNFHRTLLELPLPYQSRFAAFVAEHCRRVIEIDDPFGRTAQVQPIGMAKLRSQ